MKPAFITIKNFDEIKLTPIGKIFSTYLLYEEANINSSNTFNNLVRRFFTDLYSQSEYLQNSYKEANII